MTLFGPGEVLHEAEVNIAFWATDDTD